MKKIILLLAVLSPCVGFADNNQIKMVTYFPVPYVMYQNLTVGRTGNAGGNLDVGIGSDSPTVRVGGAFTNTGDLIAGELERQNGVVTFTNGQSVVLKYASGLDATPKSIVSGNVYVGDNGATAGTSKTSKMFFSHPVTINSIETGNTGIDKFSLVTTNLGSTNNPVGSFSIETLGFHSSHHGEEANPNLLLLPLNDSQNAAKRCNQEKGISWKELTINGKRALYLVCGQGTTPKCVAVDSGDETTLTGQNFANFYNNPSLETCPKDKINRAFYNNQEVAANYCQNIHSCVDYYDYTDNEYFNPQLSYIKRTQSLGYLDEFSSEAPSLNAECEPHDMGDPDYFPTYVLDESEMCDGMQGGIHLIESRIRRDGSVLASDVCNVIFDPSVQNPERSCYLVKNNRASQFCAYHIDCVVLRQVKKRTWRFEWRDN